MSGSVVAEKAAWVRRVLGRGVSKDETDGAAKIETRSYVRDISPDLQALLKIDAGARQDVQDWWASVLGHLPRCEISVDVRAGSKTWKKIDSNTILENKFGLFTHERVEAGLPQLAKSLQVVLLRTDAALPPLSEPPTPKVQANIDKIWGACQQECNDKIAEFQSEVSREVVGEIRRTFTELKETKEEVAKYQFVAGMRVFKGIVLIAGNIAHAAASWGATSPMAIVLIVRQAVEIAQIVGKGLADAEDMGRLVAFDLKAIQTFYSDDPDSGKAQNNLVESAAGVVSGVLGLEIPSIKNCNTHIGDFDHKVRLAETDFHKMGSKLAELSGKIDELTKKIASVKSMGAGKRIHKKLSNEEAIKQFEKLIEGFGKTYTALFEEVPEVEGTVNGYKEKSEDWKQTLVGFEKQTSGWTKYVPTLAALATETGLGMGHVAGEHVETAVEIASQHLKEGLEAATIVMNGLADEVLERMAD